MQVLINGEQQTIEEGITIQDLVMSLTQLKNRRVVVAQNGVIIPKSQYQATIVCVGDSIDVIEAVGGG
ncbi:MAG: sulfur carrier protein ThiS [Methylacidiphilales bacterium]|nr:sulfur carrier protein ThiS [Candidatus Methylacidiphilales bacterium]